MNESRTTCRICNSSGIQPVLSLGTTPLADGLRRKDQLSGAEPVFPLNVAFCPRCSLMQLLETVPPEQLFCEDYPYYSSFSPALLKHSRENALDLIAQRKLTRDSLVLELASNDGYLLKNFVECGIPVLGIDPAEGPARAAEQAGVPTLCTFFGESLARELKASGKAADVIIGNNVLAHVADLHGFVEGIRTLLKEDGVAVIEMPYVKDLVDHCEFDTIYHEHLCYFSVTALDYLFRMHSLFLNNVKRLSIHGGSLRIYVEKKENVSSTVRDMLRMEATEKVNRIDFYRDFAKRVEGIRSELRRLLEDLKGQGAHIAAYGAAAKGSTMINYSGIGTEFVDFVVDRNTHKQGLYMPGKHIPVLAPEALLDQMPGYVLLLAWNFADEILQQQKEYQQRGGRFIIPVPNPRVV
ncbi:MAG: class I SAM-dependent methyltransferase [Candidatus Acidiferrales bacterium]